MLAVAVEFQPDFRVAPDHGERGPELVGDFGEERSPGAGGLNEHLLGALALCNVPRDAFHGDNVLGLVVDRLVALLGPDQAAVLAIPAQHERLFRRAHRALQQVSVFRVDPLEAEIRVCVVLLRTVAGHGCGRGAYVLEAGRRMEAEAID